MLYITYYNVYNVSHICLIFLGNSTIRPIDRGRVKMREIVPECGMVDVNWLHAQTRSHEQIPAYAKRLAPIIDKPDLHFHFLKLNRRTVTFIACTDASDVAIGIPFLVGSIAAKYSENFKMILAQKIWTQYTIDLLNKAVPISREDIRSPVRLGSNPSDLDTNLKIVTFSNAFNYIEEALALSNSCLTDLIIDEFNGENALDMELLYRAIQLAQMQEQFRVIVLTYGVVHDSQNRVVKICEGLVSLNCVNLLRLGNDLPNRDVVVFDSTTDNIMQVKDTVYEKSNFSTETEVHSEREESLTVSQLKKQVNITVWLINHFIDDEISLNIEGSPFTYVVFTGSNKILRILKNEISRIAENVNAEIITVRYNNDIKYAREKNGRIIVLVSDIAEDAFILDNVNIVFDMGLTSFKSNATSIGSNKIRTTWADGIRMTRRAKIVSRGTVAYSFDLKKLKWMKIRSISKFAAFDLDLRYFHDSKQWSYRLNEERTNGLMKRAEQIFIRAGLISYKDPRYSTSIGSFCSSVLPMLSPRMAKLVLCGIVCGCEDAAVALATILSEDSAAIECSRKMSYLMEFVKVKIRSEHLCLLHAYDRRFGHAKSVFPNYSQIHSMEKRERVIRRRIQKECGKASVGIFADDEEMEMRLLLALAMAFGDRIGYARNGDDKGETRFFHLNDPDNAGNPFQFESSTKFRACEEEAGIYFEMRDKDTQFDTRSVAEVTMLPVTILAAIGNIGGRVVKSTMGLSLTTNTGRLHVKMSEYEGVDEMIDMRNEVMMEVEKVALSYLQSDRYTILFKKERDNWMDELIHLLLTS